MRTLSVLFALSMVACGDAPTADEPVKLSWTQGQMFHVGARYQVTDAMTEEVPTSLEEAADPQFGENWSDEVVWTYQVVETGFVPAAGDDLYDFAATSAGTAPLAVVRAWVDPALNDDPELLEADPVVYLVFREDRDRLAGIVQFLSVDGERVEKAWSSRQLGRSWSALSQSMLTAAPTYLAPFAARWATEERTLENGSTLSTELVDAGVVDAYYDDEIGGGLVMSRYEAGQPWPTWTVTDGVEARLLTDDDVAARRANLPFLLPDEPEDFDYVAALSSSVDIDAALTLDADTIDGGWDAIAREGYRPWAGSWWPQSEGALVFGYNGRDTISDRIKADIDPIKKELDKLSEELRKLDKGSSEYQEKVKTYQDKQGELVDKLVAFYNGVLQDLDGGRLKVENGKLAHVDGWSYDLDELSPMDKFALQLWANGETYPNPFFGPAWELLNHYSPAGGSWWGHCNGWAAAAILTHEPRESVSATIEGQAVDYTVADLKGLLSESHYSTYSRFYGERYNGEEDDVSDLTPKAFHIIVSHYVRDREVPLVFDTTATEEVWNFPAYAVDLDVEETTEPSSAAGKLNINTADVAAIDALPYISSTVAQATIAYREQYGPFQTTEDIKKVKGIGDGIFRRIKDQITVDVASGERTFDVVAEVTFATDGVDEAHIDGSTPKGFTETYRYTLVTDEQGVVLRGTWADDKEHPDFAWVPYDNPTSRASGGSENPYLPYGSLLGVIGDEFRRK